MIEVSSLLMTVFFYERLIFKRIFFLFQNFAKNFLNVSVFVFLPPTILSPQSSKCNIFKMLMRLGHPPAQNTSVHFIFIFVFFPLTLPTNVFFPGFMADNLLRSPILLNMPRFFLFELFYIFKFHFLR